jgi:hypothetical protein
MPAGSIARNRWRSWRTLRYQSSRTRPRGKKRPANAIILLGAAVIAACQMADSSFAEDRARRGSTSCLMQLYPVRR